MKHRLYIISGKGGTGKTTFAIALTKYLQERGKNVQYTAFDHEIDRQKIDHLKVPFFDTTVEKSCEKYIGLKLKSETIARWIMKTPFFSALFSILPSLGSMILLGHFIKELEDDPSLVIVLDSPATGHAKAMLEATYNFKEIFKAGILVQDIYRMHDFLHNEENLKSFICSLPTEMSLQEAGELKTFMSEKNIHESSIILNNYIEMYEGMYPNLQFLNNKHKAEKSIISEFSNSNEIFYKIPKILSHDPIQIIHSIKNEIENIL